MDTWVTHPSWLKGEKTPEKIDINKKGENETSRKICLQNDLLFSFISNIILFLYSQISVLRLLERSHLGIFLVFQSLEPSIFRMKHFFLLLYLSTLVSLFSFSSVLGEKVRIFDFFQTSEKEIGIFLLYMRIFFSYTVSIESESQEEWND